MTRLCFCAHEEGEASFQNMVSLATFSHLLTRHWNISAKKNQQRGHKTPHTCTTSQHYSLFTEEAVPAKHSSSNNLITPATTDSTLQTRMVSQLSDSTNAFIVVTLKQNIKAQFIYSMQKLGQKNVLMGMPLMVSYGSFFNASDYQQCFLHFVMFLPSILYLLVCLKWHKGSRAAQQHESLPL